MMLEHLQWFGNFGLAFVVVCQLPIANAKKKYGHPQWFDILDLAIT